LSTVATAALGDTVLLFAERLLRQSPTGRVPDPTEPWSPPQGGSSSPDGWLEYGTSGITLRDYDRAIRQRWTWPRLRSDLHALRARDPDGAARRDAAEANRLVAYWHGMAANVRRNGPAHHYLGEAGHHQDLAMFERYVAMAADEADAARARIGASETQLALFGAN
jgi:hypothetical protein